MMWIFFVLFSFPFLRKGDAELNVNLIVVSIKLLMMRIIFLSFASLGVRGQGNVDEFVFTPTEGASSKSRTGVELLDSYSHGKNISEKEGGELEVAASACELDTAQVKAKSPPVKGRQSQSGPLVPGVVYGQTSTEKSHIFERLILVN